MRQTGLFTTRRSNRQRAISTRPNAVPTGRYQSVNTAATKVALTAHAARRTIAPATMSHATPNTTKMILINVDRGAIPTLSTM